MSLYSSLTQVLAPYAAKLNGLLTGWDGTTYSSPGEAVRQQIADLHVLIGDEPGTAIQGEAISYDGTTSGLTATTVQAAIDESAAALSSTNERLDKLGITEDLKQALLAIASKVAYVDENGQDYYDALEAALYPPRVLESISCVFTQDGTVYDSADIDSLKSGLVVTAVYEDGSSVLPDSVYTLSGTLSAGTSTVTVSYQGKTTTFTVAVTAAPSGYTFYDYVTRNDTTSMPANSGIVTDIGFTAADTLETQYRFTKTQSTWCPVMGIRNGQSGRKEFGLFCKPSTGEMGWWYCNTETPTSVTPFAIDTLYDIKVRPVGGASEYPEHATITVNGTVYDTGSAVAEETFNSWLGLFKWGSSATTTSSITTDRFCGQQIGRTKITSAQGTILHDLRPASDGTYNGFYDTVGEKFYYNADFSTYYLCGNWGES